MKFSQYISESAKDKKKNVEAERAAKKFLSLSEDPDQLFKKLRRSSNDIEVELFKNNIFVKDVIKSKDKQFNILIGYFIYTLNGPSEQYEDDKYDFPETDYFYVGSFEYNIDLNKILNIRESTKRFENVRVATKHCINELSLVLL